MPHIPPSSDGAPTPLNTGGRLVQLLQEGLAWLETLKLSAWYLKALQAMPIDWTSPLSAIFFSTLQLGT